MELNKFVKWHHDRNLIEGATDKGQFKKLMSEFGELSDNLARGSCVKDDIGDCAVVLINIAERNECVSFLINNHLTCVTVDYIDLLGVFHDLGYSVHNEFDKHYKTSMIECLVNVWESLKGFAKCNNLDFDECLSVAYDDIKDRKGKMVNGTFVKESNLGDINEQIKGKS